MEYIVSELFYGLMRLLAHPLPYILLVAMMLLAYKRVKRERQQFHVRVQPEFLDVFPPLFAGLCLGAFLSILTFVAGLSTTMAFIWLLTFVTVVLLLAGPRFLSPAVVLGATVLLALYLPLLEGATGYEAVDHWLAGIGEAPLLPIVSLLALFVFLEGLLAMRQGKTAAPVQKRSSRGKWVGGFEVKRLWPLPVVLFLPGGMLEPIGWWPLLPVGEEGLAVFIVPFAIGMQSLVFRELPTIVLKQAGLRVIALSFLLIGFAITAWFEPLFIVVTAVVAIVARIGLLWFEYVKEAKAAPYFSPQTGGLMVLAVLPNSPAEKMGLQSGEVIVKVNGVTVYGAASYYQGIQENSAYCKIEAVNLNGEVRRLEGSVHASAHHELGVLFVKEKETNTPATQETAAETGHTS
ncbi:PDZ domain-containing protein [Salsuginibacillus kocurii]|uniref:PDZ domain-containing protein n=1 Tax=Salsuginibacillus kocurii TaxID=427078 RepID=UPI00036E0BE1|nr:PDZ domain-containing protein [Salsuginibacillus kocurii]